MVVEKNTNIAMVVIYRLISLFFVLIVVFSSCSRSYSPEEVTFKNDTLYLFETNTPFSGYIRTYYDNGKQKSVKEYKNGLAHGYYLRFYPSGKLSLKMEYSNGKPLYFIQYYENSNIKAKQFDSVGLQWIFRYNEKGNLIQKETLKNGLLNGTSYQYYDDGKIYIQTQYVNGKKNGLFKMFFANGKPKAECYFVNDSINGIFKVWTEDGFYGEEYFENGKRAGVWRYYYPNKKIKAEVYFTDKGTVKERIEYDENGKIIDKFVSSIEHYD